MFLPFVFAEAAFMSLLEPSPFYVADHRNLKKLKAVNKAKVLDFVSQKFERLFVCSASAQ